MGSRKSHLLRLLPAACLATLLSHIHASPTAKSTLHQNLQVRSSTLTYNPDNVAVYWGQAPGSADSSLTDLCNQPTVNVVMLAFVRDFSAAGGYPRFDIGTQCIYLPADNTAGTVPQCTAIAAGITRCQQLGKPVLLSVGGGSTKYTVAFPTPQSAIDAASVIWLSFVAPEGTSSTTPRPFPGVYVDGFDIDHETGSGDNFDVFVKTLQSYASTTRARLILSATASCSGNDSLTNPTFQMMDFVSVRFYNAKKCEWGSAGFQASLTQWCDLLAGLGTRLYASAKSFESGTGSGYIQPDLFGALLRAAKTASPNCFGGAMLWEGSKALVTTASDGTNYLAIAKNAMAV